METKGTTHRTPLQVERQDLVLASTVVATPGTRVTVAELPGALNGRIIPTSEATPSENIGDESISCNGEGNKLGKRSSQLSQGDYKRALKVKEASFRYGICGTNLHRMIKSGSLRSVKIGRSRLVPVDALEALLKGN